MATSSADMARRGERGRREGFAGNRPPPPPMTEQHPGDKASLQVPQSLEHLDDGRQTSDIVLHVLNRVAAYRLRYTEPV